MSTRPQTIEAHLDLLPLMPRKMFGEYGIYLEGKMVALVRDDWFFLKDLPQSRAHRSQAPLGAPHPGVKPHADASAARDAPEPLVAALRLLAETLPAPKPRRAT